jgi:hypothetical protein
MVLLKGGDMIWQKRATMGAWLLGALGCGLATALAVGCDNSCYSDRTCEGQWGGSGAGTGGSGGGSGSGSGGSGGGAVCPADPISGEVADECGIWVSSSLGKDENPGTQAAPLKTLGVAIDRAAKQAQPVYACAEVFEGPVELYAGVSLFGGFDCERQGWPYVANATGKNNTVLTAGPGLIPLTVYEGMAESTVADFTVVAAGATVPGGSSIAVLALDESKVTFRRDILEAGNGADGEDGEDGDHDGATADGGIPGHDGADACSAGEVAGGAAVKRQCEDGTDSIGGNGGNGQQLDGTDGTDGQDLPVPNPFGLGAHGKGENTAMVTPCTPGIGGAAGVNGADGLAIMGPGRLTSAGYLGYSGQDGTHGTAGQGGGGGGGSGGKLICGAAPHGGASGGSGGSGGCGGKPGKGGQAGGSSIGAVALSRGVWFDDVLIRTGNAGNAGNGGTLQPGGFGGGPGHGGLGLGAGVDGAKPGCFGGGGGNGGNGGNGGGGGGGHSVGVAFVKGQPPHTPTYLVEWGEPGKGGVGGNPNLTASQGATGAAASYWDFDP